MTQKVQDSPVAESPTVHTHLWSKSIEKLNHAPLHGTMIQKKDFSEIKK
jgi:hypothetical protein